MLPQIFDTLLLKYKRYRMGLVAIVLLSIILAGWLLLIFADALFVFPATVRQILPWFVGVAGIVVFIYKMWRGPSHKDVVVKLEKSDIAAGSKLVNSLQLSQQEYGHPCAEILRHEAVAIGVDHALGLDVWVLHSRIAKICVTVLAGVCLLWVGAFVLAPRIIETVTPRYLDPYGDHPPYSSLVITIDPKTSTVVYGGEVEVKAKLNAPSAAGLYLVCESGGSRTTLPMYRRSDKNYSQILSGLFEPATFWVTDGRARSLLGRVDIHYTPRLSKLEIEVEYPEYTGIKPASFNPLVAQLDLPKGSKLKFIARSNRALSGGSLKIAPLGGGREYTVDMSVVAGKSNTVCGELELAGALAFTLSLTAEDGMVSDALARARIGPKPDSGPRLFVDITNEVALATPDARIPFHVSAEDDYGVERLLHYRGINGSIARDVKMQTKPLDSDGSGVGVQAWGAFELKDLGVRPGDIINYYFEAYDNYPSGPNIAVSREFRIQVISYKQYASLLKSMRARKDFLGNYIKPVSRLRRLAERLNQLSKLKDNELASEQSQIEIRRIEHELKKVQKSIEHTLAAPWSYDIEKSLSAEMRKTLRNVKSVRSGLNKKDLNKRRIAALAKKLQNAFGVANKNIRRPAMRVAQVARIQSLAAEFVRLTAQQKRLAEMSRSFSIPIKELTRLQKVKLRDLAAAQLRLQKRIGNIFADLEKLRFQLPREKEYLQFAGDINSFLDRFEKLTINNDMSAAVRKLSIYDGVNGYAFAKLAADKLDSLLSKCGGMSGKGGECLRFQPGISQMMGNTMSQLKKAIERSMGSGSSDGYNILSQQAGLYGSSGVLEAQQNESGRGKSVNRSRGGRVAISSPGRASNATAPAGKGRVVLQRNEKYPLKYRGVVGDYFKSIVDDGEAGNE